MTFSTICASWTEEHVYVALSERPGILAETVIRKTGKR